MIFRNEHAEAKKKLRRADRIPIFRLIPRARKSNFGYLIRHLLPKDRIRAWCCAQAATRAIAVMDEVSNKIGFHYELDSGTLLGTVGQKI